MNNLNPHLPVVNEVVVAPLWILHILLEGVVHVQQGQVITIYMRKPQLRVIRRFLSLDK